jgi:hypothetical protein
MTGRHAPSASRRTLPDRRTVLLEAAMTSLTTAALLASLAYGVSVNEQQPRAGDSGAPRGTHDRRPGSVNAPP